MRGHGLSQVALAKAYLQGRGVMQDFLWARAWAQLAVGSGQYGANEVLRESDYRLTASRKQEAGALAARMAMAISEAVAAERPQTPQAGS